MVALHLPTPSIKKYSPNPAINETIAKLLALGCPPIPVAPAQDPRKEGCYRKIYYKPENTQRVNINGDIVEVCGNYCPLDQNLQPLVLFTGKNPSYLDRSGRPKLVRHKDYQDRLPTESELKQWFAHPLTNVGTLGGHAGIDWIDFDAKNYATQEECDRDVQRIIANIGRDTWIEKTGSGGYRIAVKLPSKPTFTNFTTTPDGKHRGEALFNGRFTVLAPSRHPNGNCYERINNANPAEIDSLKSIGIYPTKDEIANLERKVKREDGQSKDNSFVGQISDVSDSWDIRNLATYLDGYASDNGRGYATCKCPVHGGNSLDSLHIHIATGGYRCWRGCDTKAIYAEVKQIAIASGYNPKIDSGEKVRTKLPKEIDRQTWELVYGLPGFFKRQLAKIKRKFCGKNRETQKNLLFSQPDLIFNEVQNRADLMINGFQNGFKYIHFSCHGGVGKSHFIGLLTTERFKEAGIDCDGIINCSRSGRDPATKTIEGNFHEVRVKADSMAVDPHRKTPLGYPILVHPTPENPGTVAGNCHLAEQFRIAAAKGYDIEGVKGCAKFGCKYYDFDPTNDTCGKSSDDGYGFRNQHKQDLAHPRIRCNIASIPDDPDYLKKKLLILDEPGQIISGVKVQELALEDIAQAQALIMTFYPEYRPILDEPLAQLHRFAVAETLPYYGADIQQIRDNISIPEEQRQLILDACADIDKRQTDKLNSKTLHTAPKLWLCKFFRVLLSEEPGAIRIGKKQVKDKKGNVKNYISLTITTVDERLRNILNNVLGVVLLDGTATKQSLADTLGINPDQILQLEQISPDYSNYTIKVITGLGNCGSANPSTEMQTRKNAIAQQFINLHGTDAPILDRQGREQKWWVDNRLQNRDAGKPARLSFGTPYQNLGALQDRLITLKGKYYKLGGVKQSDATDPELQAEINRTVQAEFIQDAWRLRSHRYLDKQFTQYYVTDFDFSFIKDELPGVELETIDAFAFTPEAGDALQQTKWHITQEFQKLLNQGRDITTITQKEIAEGANRSLSYLKKIVSAFGSWQEFKQGILALLTNYSGSVPSPENQMPEELQWFGDTWLPVLAGEIRQGNVSAFEDIGNILKIYGVKAFHLVCRYCDPSVRSDILMGILQLIPLNQFEKIWQTD